MLKRFSGFFIFFKMKNPF